MTEISEATKERWLKELEDNVARYNLPRYRRVLEHPFLTIKNSVMTRLLHLMPGDRVTLKVKAKTFFGETMVVTLPGLIGEGVLFYKAFLEDSEVRLAKFLIKHLDDGDVFFDIGANLGYYSLLASGLVGERGSVYAFEPAPTVLPLLHKNAANKRNIHIVGEAIGDSSLPVDFYLAEQRYSGISTTNLSVFERDRKGCRHFKKVVVQSRKLDDFCLSKNVFPAVIKIDVEGAEEKVLSGAGNVLEKHPAAVAIEIFFDPFTENYRNALGILKYNNYRCYAIDDAGRLMQLEYENLADYFKKLRQKTNYPICYDNLVFKK